MIKNIIKNSYVIKGVKYSDVVKSKLKIIPNKIIKHDIFNENINNNVEQKNKFIIKNKKNYDQNKINLKNLIIDHNNAFNKKNNNKNITSEYYDNFKRQNNKMLLDNELYLLELKKEFIRKKIKIEKIQKEENYLKAMMIYNALKKKLNNEIIKFNKDMRIKDIDTKDTIYMTILMESLSKTYTEVSNKLCISKEIDFSSNTFCDRRQKMDSTNINDLNNVLLTFIKHELNIKLKIYAVDGSKISLSLRMRKEGFPMVRQKTKNIKKINNIKEKYKIEIKETRIDYKDKISNVKDKNSILLLKEQKKKSINELFEKRNNEILLLINEDDEYTLCDNINDAHYCKGLITSIYDVVNKFPVKIDVCKHLNERKHIMELIDENIEKGSIIIFDRGYYSEELLIFLNQRGIIPIFRLCCSNIQSKELIKTNSNEIMTTIENINFKTIRYNINDNDYFIGTTNTQLQINDLKNMYWLRWTIEEFYKKQKHTII